MHELECFREVAVERTTGVFILTGVVWVLEHYLRLDSWASHLQIFNLQMFSFFLILLWDLIHFWVLLGDHVLEIVQISWEQLLWNSLIHIGALFHQCQTIVNVGYIKWLNLGVCEEVFALESVQTLHSWHVLEVRVWGLVGVKRRPKGRIWTRKFH